MIVLNILGWIAAGLLVLLSLVFLLLLPSVRVCFSLQSGQMKVIVCYLFLFYRIYPFKEKPKKKKRKKPAPKEDEKEPPAPEDKQKKTFTMQTLRQYRRYIRKAQKILRSLCKRLVIYKVKARVQVAGDDAHRTALKYSKTACLAAVLMHILGKLFTVKKADIIISPDFLREQSACDISFRLRIRPIFLLIAGVRFMFIPKISLRTFKAYLKGPKQSRKTRKGGKKYESTTSHR